ncbi:MAG: hypothetical protein LBM27_02535 [Lactobacillaceae bacterium]|jgi:hypothetical protein|nr:hypothetical protein [Lactobacillaceae bacterium]
MISLNSYHPTNALLDGLTNFSDDIKAAKEQGYSGLVFKTNNIEDVKKAKELGFKEFRKTVIGTSTVSHLKSNPRTSLAADELSVSQKGYFYKYFIKHYKNSHLVNPPMKFSTEDIEQLTFNDPSMNQYSSRFYFDKEGISGYLIIFDDGKDYELGWVGVKNEIVLSSLWNDFKNSARNGALITGEFDSTDSSATKLLEIDDFEIEDMIYSLIFSF